MIRVGDEVKYRGLYGRVVWKTLTHATIRTATDLRYVPLSQLRRMYLHPTPRA